MLRVLRKGEYFTSCINDIVKITIKNNTDECKNDDNGDWGDVAYLAILPPLQQTRTDETVVTMPAAGVMELAEVAAERMGI